MNRKKLYFNVSVVTAADSIVAAAGLRVILATFRCTKYTAGQTSTEKFGGFLSRLAQATSTASALNLVKHEVRVAFNPTSVSLWTGRGGVQFLIDLANTAAGAALTDMARATNFMVRLWATGGANGAALGTVNVRRIAGTLTVERQHSIEV
jgi:hypothetical protein